MTFSPPQTITSSMEQNEITDRLRTLGEQPVPDATKAAHLHRMADASGPEPRRFGRLAVAAAAMVGFFAGSTGLAMAGALPDPAQGVAHDVLSVVQVDVPSGKEGKRGPCVSQIAKDPNLDEATKAARKAECPKGPFGPPTADGERPGRSGEAPGRQKADKHANDPCRGKPPWAGPGMTAEQRAAAKEQHAADRAAAGCPMGPEDPAEAQREAAEEAEEAEEQQLDAQELEEQQEQAPAPPTPPTPPAPTPPAAEGETPPAPEGEEAPTEGT